MWFRVCDGWGANSYVNSVFGTKVGRSVAKGVERVMGVVDVVAVWCRGHGCCVAMGRTPMPTVCSAPRANPIVSRVFSTVPCGHGANSYAYSVFSTEGELLCQQCVQRRPACWR